MKIVKENLFEKFLEDSDPIHDLGIGNINLGKIRAELKKEFKEKFVQTFKDLLLNKSLSGHFNEVLVIPADDPMNIRPGKGWGNYTIFVDEILEEPMFDENSISIMVHDKKKNTAYIIPFTNKKIFINNVS